jgi:ketohexokinase
VVDTLGAGDTFNAAIIDGLCRQQDLAVALRDACRLAGKKCGQIGFQGLSKF